MNRPFKKFTNFKSHIFAMYRNIASTLRPLDIESTCRKTWSTVFRMPAYLLEPKFLEIFDLNQSNFPSKEEVHKKALEVREKASNILTEKKPLAYFLNEANFSNIQKAIKITMHQLGLRPQMFDIASLDNAANALPTTTSTGHPDYVQHKSENLVHALHQAKFCFNMLNTDWTNYILTMAWRTQQRVSGLKYRIIWVTSHVSQIFEMCFFLPVRNYFQEHKDTPYCYGNVFTDLVPRIQELRNTKQIVVIDYTSFDQTVPPELIDLFFTAFKSCFKMRSKGWDIQFEAIRRYNLFATVFNLKDGVATLFNKVGSISSGSVLTNFMGSWINLFIMNLFLLENGFDPLNDYKPNVMGDDCSHGFNFEFPLPLFSEWLLANFGMEVEPQKCQVLPPNFDTVEFLGSDLNENGRYLNKDLAIKQLTVSHIFIGESVMSEAERLISKAASICFKHTDGWIFFDEIIEKLKPKLNLTELPEFYYELFFSSAGPYEIMTKRRISDYKYNGWMVQ